MTRTTRTGDMYKIYLNGRLLDWFQADRDGSDNYRTIQGVHDAHWDAITATTAIRDAFQSMGIPTNIERTWTFREESHEDYDVLVYDIKTMN